jgi:hypothetical protein
MLPFAATPKEEPSLHTNSIFSTLPAEPGAPVAAAQVPPLGHASATQPVVLEESSASLTASTVGTSGAPLWFTGTRTVRTVAAGHEAPSEADRLQPAPRDTVSVLLATETVTSEKENSTREEASANQEACRKSTRRPGGTAWPPRERVARPEAGYGTGFARGLGLGGHSGLGLGGGTGLGLGGGGGLGGGSGGGEGGGGE